MTSVREREKPFSEDGVTREESSPSAVAGGALRRALSGIISRQVLGSLSLGLSLAILSWPAWLLPPQAGLDPSWNAALSMAAKEHLVAGRDLSFTYGPLGFLASQFFYYGSTGAMAFVYSGAVHIIGAVALLLLLRKIVPAYLAYSLAYVGAMALTFVGPTERAVLLLAVAYVVVIRLPVSHRLQLALLLAGSVIAALHLLIKFNDGLVLGGITVVAAWHLHPQRWRGVALAGAVSGSAFVALWQLSSGDLADLPRYVSRSMEITNGFSAAMGGTYIPHGPAHLHVIAWGAGGLLIGALWQQGFLRRPFASICIVGAVVFAAFKHGFVREDSGHVASFFAALMVVILLIYLVPKRRSHAAIAVVAFILTALSVFRVADGVALKALIDPRDNLSHLHEQVAGIFLKGQRTSMLLRSRATMRSEYALSSSTLSFLRGSVHVEPWEASIFWAYPELRWRPLPAFQSYLAYTSLLDRDNARFLRSGRAPDQILRETQRAIDRRNPDWDPPETTLAMLCHYREVHSTERWQVLARSANRCGREVPLGEWRGGFDERVEVPQAPPGEMVVARIHGLESAVMDRLFTLIYRASETGIRLQEGKFRVVAGTAKGPLLMVAPTELGFSAGFGYRQTVTSFSVERQQRVGLPRNPHLRIEFFRIPLSD
jgi:hypothetical protein